MNNPNERRNMLKALQSLSLTLLDTSLFLDTHPNNQKALDFYRKNKQSYESLRKTFTDKYGAITTLEAAKNSWEWVDSPWPWEN